MTDGPLIVQSDKTLLLEVEHPLHLIEPCSGGEIGRRATEIGGLRR